MQFPRKKKSKYKSRYLSAFLFLIVLHFLLFFFIHSYMSVFLFKCQLFLFNPFSIQFISSECFPFPLPIFLYTFMSQHRTKNTWNVQDLFNFCSFFICSSPFFPSFFRLFVDCRYLFTSQKTVFFNRNKVTNSSNTVRIS